MAVIARSFPWIRQPQGAVELNLAHPLARGIQFCWHGGFELVDLARRLRGNISGASRQTRGNLTGFQFSGGNVGVNFGTATPIQPGAQNYTVAFVGVAPATGRGHAYSQGLESGSFPQITMAYGLANNGGGSAGSVSLLEFQGGALFGIQVAGAADGSLKTFMAVRNGSTPSNGRMYVNGRSASATTNGSGGTISNTGLLLRVGSPAGYVSGDRTYTEPLFLSVAWDRSFSDAEAAAFHENPWQIFAPVTRRIISIAASGIPTLSAATAIDITATTARPQVTLTF